MGRCCACWSIHGSTAGLHATLTRRPLGMHEILSLGSYLVRHLPLPCKVVCSLQQLLKVLKAGSMHTCCSLQTSSSRCIKEDLFVPGLLCRLVSAQPRKKHFLLVSRQLMPEPAVFQLPVKSRLSGQPRQHAPMSCAGHMELTFSLCGHFGCGGDSERE